MKGEDILSRLSEMRKFFDQGNTIPFEFRRQRLLQLKSAVLKYEKQLHAALYNDLKKNPEECWVTETGFLVAEINHALRHLKKWMRPGKVPTNLVNLPSSSYILKQPVGVVLIIAPWNYPLQLLFTPLVGAMAAGNCIVLKPSEFAAATADVMEILIQETFGNEYISLVQGSGYQVVPELMSHFRFDHIFYTGSTAVGRDIYKMAAEKLVPVTLELGGKSPCIVEADADLDVAARRIVSAKFSNAGQMCVAPDYLMVHRSIRERFVKLLIESIRRFYGEDPSQSYHYGKIINEKQFVRLKEYLSQGEVVYGGNTDLAKLFISPTIMENINTGSALMTEEIFGPILPVLEFENTDDIRRAIAANPDPLALYVFTASNGKAMKWMREISFGGGCVNNASWHLTNYNLPFGGIGNSGLGACHGKAGFDTFTHRKPVMKTPTFIDPSIKYPPFKGKLSLFKRVIK